jgi:hypothetical protein
VTVSARPFELRGRWRTCAQRLVSWRHPTLLAVALISAFGVRADVDWKLLSDGGNGLFSASPLSVYAKTPYLQAGPPGLVVVRGLNLLPGTSGPWIAHILLAFLGWYLLYLVERWTVPGSSWRSIPLGPGLLTLAIGVMVLEQWAWLAGFASHPEDGLALLCFLLALRALMTGRDLRAALLIGLAAAWKPWAVVALPLVTGCSRKCRALMIALAIPTACWLPFILGDHSTLSAVGHGFPLLPDSTLRLLGLSGKTIPDWWRSVQLSGALAGAALAARRDWRVAFAAGCAMRLLLDPAGLGYYDAGLLMVTAITERLTGSRPWRTAVLWALVAYLQYVVPGSMLVALRFVGLAGLYLSWVLPRRRTPAVPSDLVPAQRAPLPNGRLAQVAGR